MDPEDIQDRVNFVELDATSPDWPVHLPSLFASVLLTIFPNTEQASRLPYQWLPGE